MKRAIFSKIKKFFNLFEEKPIIASLISTLLVNLVIESLSRHSLIDGIVHLVTNPLIFLYNSILIYSTICFAFLFKRRNFMILLISILWMSLGLVNCIVQLFRVTPLTLMDLTIIQSALSIVPLYLGFLEIFLIVFWVCLALAALVVAWIKLPKGRISFKKSLPLIAGALCVASLSSVILVSSPAAKKASFAHLPSAYDKWGFTYCFWRGLIDSGIEKPDDYSKKDVHNAMKLIELPKEDEAVQPNVIVMQLESFFNPAYLKGYTFSENPIPTFTSLMESNPSGLLTVPSFGGGTANTEFEILTGLSLELFGIGEYPYQTVLQKKPCESIATILNDKGYVSTALHNHTATFYTRNKAYASLGFDKFSAVEHMDTEKNELGWAKDSVFLDEIPDALTTTPEKDFLFAVTVQGHGKYPTEPMEYENNNFNVLEDETHDKGFVLSLEYYMSQINQTDNMLKELVEYLEEYPEPVALVVYGDHLPAFNIDDSDLEGINTYQTEYFIWTNYADIGNTKENISSYQLSALMFDKLNLNAGILPRVTQKLKAEKNYKEILSLFGYDILYGKGYCLDEKLKISDISYGIKPIVINEVELREETALIHGGKFTEYSNVFVNGKKVNTTFVNSETLKISLDCLKKKGCNIKVMQLDFYANNLGESEPFEIAPF